MRMAQWKLNGVKDTPFHPLQTSNILPLHLSGPHDLLSCRLQEGSHASAATDQLQRHTCNLQSLFTYQAPGTTLRPDNLRCVQDPMDID